jgi:hypothetical protein
MRRSKEKRPFESWQQLEAVAARLGLSTGQWLCSQPRPGFDPRSCSGSSSATSTALSELCTCGGRYANGRLKHTKTRLSTRAVPLQAVALAALKSAPAVSEPTALPERARSSHRLPQLRPPSLADSPGRGRHRATSPSLRPPPHLRHVRTARRRLGVRGLALHGFEHRDDRPPLRPPRPRQPRTRHLTLDALAVERAVDAGWTSHQGHAKQVSNSDSTPRRKRLRRAVDVRWTPGRPTVVAFAKKRC